MKDAALLWSGFISGLLAVVFGIILAAAMFGCTHVPFLGSPEDWAYSEEYDYSRPHGRTPQTKAYVYFPTWLVVEDRPAVVANIESTFSIIKREYPFAEGFPFGDLTIYIHDSNLGVFVAGYGLKCWCYGWQSGQTVYVCWQPIKDAGGAVTGLTITDCLYALPHELFHMILAQQHGRNIPNDDPLWQTPEVVRAIDCARKEAMSVALSQKSLTAALAFKYVPWYAAPGGPK